jgi:hypothetical protein
MSTRIIASMLIIIITLSVVQVFSQRFEYGPHAGISASKLSSRLEIQGDASRSGILAGLFFRFNLGKIYIQPEGNLMMKGGKRHFDWAVLNSPNPTDQVCETLEITSLDVPVIMGIKLINFGVINFRLLSGPVASFPVLQNSHFEKNGSSVKLVDYDEDLKNPNWGVQFGAGIDFLMLSLDARYEMGLSDLNNIPENSVQSSMLMLSLGWKFR